MYLLLCIYYVITWHLSSGLLTSHIQIDQDQNQERDQNNNRNKIQDSDQLQDWCKTQDRDQQQDRDQIWDNNQNRFYNPDLSRSRIKTQVRVKI